MIYGASMVIKEVDFLTGLRHLALSFVDLLERKLEISPRTAEIRKWHKQYTRKKQEGTDGQV